MNGIHFANSAVLVGKVMNIAESHQQFGVSYYDIVLRVNRTTVGKYDDIVVCAPEWLKKPIEEGMTISVIGEVRTYRNHGSGWQQKETVVYAKKIVPVFDYTAHKNQIVLQGMVDSVLPIRSTPLTNRMITDFSVRVDRLSGYAKQGGFDVISCVAWGRYAHLVSAVCEPGKVVKINGRIQTRAFEKKHKDGRIEPSQVTEISAISVESI